MIIGISGPLCTGKSTLISLLKETLPGDTIYVEDPQDKVYKDLVEQGLFREYCEITKDRDYLFVYFEKLIEYYNEMLDTWRDYDGLVVFDGTYIDLLIYGMLNLWYHKMIAPLMEKCINSLLGNMNDISLIYMTVADNPYLPNMKGSLRKYNTAFRKNRPLELSYYDIFRDKHSVITLPDSILSCDSFIYEDLKKRSII